MDLLPTETIHIIVLFVDNKLLVSSLNKYFYDVVHQLDNIIYEHIDLNLTPEFTNHIKIFDGFTNLGMTNFGFAERVKYVKSLILNNNLDVDNLVNLVNLDMSLSENMTNFEKLTNLQSLICSNNDLYFNEAINLRSLKLIADENIFCDAQISKLTNLTELDLGNVEWEGHGHIGSLVSLRKLTMAEQLDTEELMSIPNLTELTLNRNCYRFNLLELPNLKTLTVNKCANYDWVRNLTNLTELNIKSDGYVELDKFSHIDNLKLNYDGPKNKPRTMRIPRVVEIPVNRIASSKDFEDYFEDIVPRVRRLPLTISPIARRIIPGITGRQIPPNPRIINSDDDE